GLFGGLFVHLADAFDVDDLLALGQPDDPDALGVAAGLADLGDAGADDLPTVGDDHELVRRADERDLHELAVTLRRVHRDDSDAATRLLTPLGHGRALAVAVGAHRKDLLRLGVFDDAHADHSVALAKLDALH